MVGRITDLEYVPSCSHYVRGSTSLDQNILAYGDDGGRINIFKLAFGWGSHEKKPGAAEINPKKLAGMTPVRGGGGRGGRGGSLRALMSSHLLSHLSSRVGMSCLLPLWGMRSCLVSYPRRVPSPLTLAPPPPQLAPYPTHSSWVTKLSFLTYSDALLSASTDSTMCLFDLTREKAKWLVKVGGCGGGRASIAFKRALPCFGGRFAGRPHARDVPP